MPDITVEVSLDTIEKLKAQARVIEVTTDALLKELARIAGEEVLNG